MKSIAVNIPTTSGIHLSARLEMPDGGFFATVLFAHCFTCGKDILAARRIARNLVAHDFAVLRFDFTGIGASEGQFSDTNFSSNIEDIMAAADWLRSNYAAPALMIGHSLGGTAILAAAKLIPEAQAFVTIGSPSDPEHIFKLIGDRAIEQIETVGDAEVNLEGRVFNIKKQFIENSKSQTILKDVQRLRKPLLIMHSPTDSTVQIEHASSLFEAAKHPKSFFSLGKSDHLLTGKSDADFVSNIIASWSKGYIEQSQVEQRV